MPNDFQGVVRSAQDAGEGFPWVPVLVVGGLGVGAFLLFRRRGGGQTAILVPQGGIQEVIREVQVPTPTGQPSLLEAQSSQARETFGRVVGEGAVLQAQATETQRQLGQQQIATALAGGLQQLFAGGVDVARGFRQNVDVGVSPTSTGGLNIKASSDVTPFQPDAGLMARLSGLQGLVGSLRREREGLRGTIGGLRKQVGSLTGQVQAQTSVARAATRRVETLAGTLARVREDVQRAIAEFQPFAVLRQGAIQRVQEIQALLQ